MSEEADVQPEGAPADNAEGDAEGGHILVQTVDDGKGNKVEMVPLAFHLETKGKLKTANKRVKELEPLVAEVEGTKKNLSGAMVFVNAIASDPKLQAEVLRRVNGGKPSEGRVGDVVDREMAEYAEDNGWYLDDGVTPNVEKAQRVVARQMKMIQRTTEEAMRPFAGKVIGREAEVNLTSVLSQTDPDGVPLASEESIREVASQLPREYLADPRVTDLMLNVAIGLDRRKGRTPKAVDEPLHLASAGGRVRQREAVTPELKTFFEKHGISEKDGAASVNKVTQSVLTGKRIALGGTK